MIFQYFQKISSLRLLILCFIFLSSCKLAYVPTSMHIPLHEEKGELISQVYFGNTGVGANSSFAATDNLAIMVGGHYLGDELLTHYSLEGSIGYFEKNDNNVFFESYLGGGYGFSERLPDQIHATGHYLGQYNKIYIQPAIGLKPGNWETALGLRTIYVSYNSFLTPPIHNFNRVFFEPTLSFKYGWDSFKFSLQGGASIPMGKLPSTLDFFPVFVSFNISHYFSVSGAGKR